MTQYSTFAQEAYADIFNQTSKLFKGTSMTYAETFDLVIRLLSPSPEPKFGMFEASRAAEPVKCVLATDAPVRMPAFPSAINFLNPSCTFSLTIVGTELCGTKTDPKIDSANKMQKQFKGEKKKKLRKPRSQKTPATISNDAAN